METSCTYTDQYMYVSTDERKWINRLLRLHEEHPDEVSIIAYPEHNDGCLYCVVPAKWLKITPPRQVNLSEEQRAAAGARLQQYRAQQNASV